MVWRHFQNIFLTCCLLWHGAGSLFLFCYGVLAFRRAVKGEYLPSISGNQRPPSLKIIFLQLAAFTYLNPQVYMDSVLLLGSLAQTQPVQGRFSFLIGTAGGSLLWFSLLGYGAKMLAPLFKKLSAWRILDIIIGITMCGLALLLLANRLV